MENILNYYYHIIIDNIDNDGYFHYNSHFFHLYEVRRNIDEIDSLVYLNNYMLNNKIPINRIIYNIERKPITYHEGKYYVLLLINYQDTNYYRMSLAPNNKILDILKRNDWAYLWSVKIDYIEYQMKHLDNRFPLVSDSINYYIGMAENAIMYFKMINKDHIPLYINHRRENKSSLYNPIELVIDYKVRDIAEYLKNGFFYYNKSIYDIKKYLKKTNLNLNDYILLYIRMLYPSYYFDIYEKIVNDNQEEDKLNIIINKIPLYEELLYEIYLIISKNNVLGISWINRKFME